MKTINSRRLGTTLIPVVCGVFATAISVAALAQGLPIDWSHRHVIYSNPDTEEEAAAKGTLHEWKKKADDPRFVLQLERKEAKAAKRAMDDANAVDEKNAAAGGRLQALSKKKSPPPTGPQIDRDWANVMGGASGSGDTRTFPAKFAFGIAAKDCVSDFVVYTTSTAGATGTGVLATRDGTFTAAAQTTAPVDTVTITNGTRTLTLTASSSVNAGLFFLSGGSANASAANLALAINRNGGTVGVTATNPGAPSATVRVTSITQGTGSNSIALADNNTRFSWAGGTLLGGTGTAGQPTIFALNQLYADTTNGGCETSTQPVPAAYWSYNTGTGAVADLSPVISYDNIVANNGKQVAFMQRSGTASSLVLLKWSSSAPGTLGAPTAPTSVTPASYGACTAPCMTVMALSGNPNNTNSAPYVDYTGDILYVGDDTGNLHKFTGVFRGTPTELSVTTGNPEWPASVGTASILSSPVYDSVSGLVFVGSNGPGLTGNRLHSINASTGAVVSSGTIGSASNANGVRDAPIVNSTAQKVYAFQGADTTAGTDSLGNSCAGPTCNSVFQFATTFAALNTGSNVFVGLSGSQNDTNRAMNSGAFDDAYDSSSGSNGSLYVCGSQPGTARLATLWKVSITGGSFSATTQGPQLASNDTNDGCSPPTVFKNGITESLYVSVNANAAALGGSGCTQTAGCMYMYRLPTAASFNTTSTSAALNSTLFISVSTAAAPNATESAVQTTLTAGQAGTYHSMTITQGANNGNATTRTYTLQRNGAPTTITCTTPVSGASCVAPVSTETFVAGDKIDVQVVRTGAQALSTTVQVQLGWNSGLAVSAALNATGGTGGIIIDNTVSGGGSQVYYSTRTPPGIAVQASQAGLQ